uniref:Flocculation protein FLO11-like n=1 Tax=Panagrellus redivivus TaxID=6233 RepID=A0A7E4V6D3_PANRE
MTDPPDTPTDRPKFPYLKKGDGIRRFRGKPPKRLSTRSLTVGNPHQNEDTRRTASASSLPYSQTPKRPTTATTTDSGLPEDQLPSCESLTQHDENDDVFVDDEVAVTMSSTNRANQNQPTNESMMAFQPNYYSTPIAKDVDACEARLNLFAPNSVRDAMKLMEKVETASTSSESLTSLQQIKTPSVAQNPPRHDEPDAVDAPEEANRRTDASTSATVTGKDEPTQSTPIVPAVFNPIHSLSSNITMPRASDYKVSIPTNFNFKRFETPLLPTSTSTRSSFPGNFASPKHQENKFLRSHSIEVDKSEFTPVKMVRFKSKPTLTVMPSHDVSLLSTPIFPKPPSGLTRECFEVIRADSNKLYGIRKSIKF